eukprot:jgi/Ulvmu1/1185/UM108_0013.1
MGKSVEKDDRFAAVRKDPRFARFPKKNMAVTIDERFKAILDDEDFAVSTATVTKRGASSNKKKGKGNHEMHQFYRLEDTPKDRDPLHPAERATGTEAEAGSGDDADAQRRYRAMRGMASDQSSSSDGEAGDSDVEPDANLDDAEVVIGADAADDIELDPSEWGIGAAAGRPDADTTLVAVDSATRRLAAVDLEWSRMRAVDVFAVLQSFVGKQGEVKEVTVYVSDYGKQEMAHEKEHGPRGLATGEGEAEATADGGKMSEEARQRVRMYERSKLRWHFAIAEFDSAATAARVYDECDGHEFEESATTFDLRFVPDAEDFAGREVRDRATSVPVGYAPAAFKSKALQHTCPQLTWDADDPDRARALVSAAGGAPVAAVAGGNPGKKGLKGKVSADELNEDNIRAYLASDSEGSGGGGSSDDGDGSGGHAGVLRAGVDAVEAARARYAALAAGGRSNGKTWGKSWADKAAEAAGSDLEHAGVVPKAKPGKKDNVDLQVSFADGLDNLAARITDKKAKGDGGGATLFEQYMQRKRDRRAAQRALGRVAHVDSGSDSDSTGDGRRGARGSKGVPAADDGNSDGGPGAGDGFDDPFFQGGDDGFDSNAESNDGGAAPGAQTAVKKFTKSSKGKRLGWDGAAYSAQARADVELLAMDDEKLLEATGAALPELAPEAGKEAPRRKTRKERLALKKQQRAAARDHADSDDEGGEFAADLSDPRFQAMANPDFAIDPTDPHFSRLKHPDDVVKEVQKKQRKKRQPQAAEDAGKGDAAVATAAARVSALADSLKRKAKAKKTVRNGGKRAKVDV